MIIKNVQVFTEDKVFQPGEIFIENGYFATTDSAHDSIIIDGNGCYAIPGLIDIHFHGCMGYDFCDGTLEAIKAIAKYQGEHGITAIAPATMTLSEAKLMDIMSCAASYPGNAGAALVGINMEGPFINAHKKGAQSAEHIKCCDAALFRRLQSASGNLIKLVDIAPEEPGAMEFIEALKDEVAISLAHTNADYDTAKAAFDAGARHVTHLYNAMPPFNHREPGVVGAARDSLCCMAELICDGIHIHPSIVRASFTMFGAERMILISDSMCATGMPDGQYMLGGQSVTVRDNRATLTHGGALAGSTTNLMDCLRTAVKQMGISLEDAVTAATINPAKAIGIDKEYGSIAAGKIANLVLLDSDLNIRQVIMH